jgi:hypothetical protein
MKTVIGLFWSEDDIQSSIQTLENAGVPTDNVDILSHISRKRLCDNLCHPVARSAGWGAVIGVAIYATSGLITGIAGCHYCGFDSTYALGTLVGFLIVGGLVGALLGQWIGLDALEQNSHLYTHAAQVGGMVVAVQASDELVGQVAEILRQENAIGVRMLPD